MKLYFSLKSIPELTDLSPAQRRLAWHASKGTAWRRWPTWMAAVVAAAVGLGLAYAVMYGLFMCRFYLIIHIGVLPTFGVIGFLGGVILVAVTQILWWPVVAGQIRPSLQQYAEAHRRKMQEIRDNVAADDQGDDELS